MSSQALPRLLPTRSLEGSWVQLSLFFAAVWKVSIFQHLLPSVADFCLYSPLPRANQPLGPTGKLSGCTVGLPAPFPPPW